METKVEYTKGPWTVSESDRNGQAIIRGVFYEIATCWHHSVKSIEREMEANARLIAAAPEMLEALELVNSLFNSYANEDTDEMATTMRKVVAAIRKARGDV